MRFRWNGSYGYRTLYLLTVQQIFRYTRDKASLFGIEVDAGFDAGSAFKWLKGVFVGGWGDYNPDTTAALWKPGAGEGTGWKYRCQGGHDPRHFAMSAFVAWNTWPALAEYLGDR